jgi:uncharacterized protein YbjQ (UPF0145 family)
LQDAVTLAQDFEVADESRETEITMLCGALPLATSADEARQIFAEIQRLIAGRSAAMVERIERARGLRKYQAKQV